MLFFSYNASDTDTSSSSDVTSDSGSDERVWSSTNDNDDGD